MKDDPITAAELSAGIPDSVRPFILVDSLALPRSMASIATAFWEAISLLSRSVSIERVVHIQFATSPFTWDMGNVELSITTKGDVINATVKSIIVIDCNKMAALPHEMQVVCVLEEFVHAVMHVKDEGAARQIVAVLYGGVTIRGGKYVARDKAAKDAPLNG